MLPYTIEQDRERHALVGLPQIQERNDIAYFSGLTLDTLKILKKKGYIDVDECQNDSPSIEQFMTFMGSKTGKNITGLTAHGYIVSNGRNDRRISLEGLEHTDNRPESLQDFAAFNRKADELSDHRSWWD